MLRIISLVAFAACSPAAADPEVRGSAPVVSAPAPRVYVANQESATISVIDTESDTVAETIDLTALGFPATAKPHHTAVEPDGAFWYVSLIGAGKVLKFDAANRLVGQADTEVPGMLALHPSADRLYVGRSMMAVNPPQRIAVIERSTMQVEEIDVFFPRPHALVVDPRGGHVYVGSLAVNQIGALDLESDRLELTSLDGPPHVLVQFALSPDGRTMVATGHLTGKVLVFDTTNPAAVTLIRTLDVNPVPWHPTFTPDGRYVYLGNQGTNTVTVIDTANWSIAEVIAGNGLAEPHGIAASADGQRVYVSNRNTGGAYDSANRIDGHPAGTVVVIDTASRTITKVIEVGRYAAGMSTGAGS